MRISGSKSQRKSKMVLRTVAILCVTAVGTWATPSLSAPNPDQIDSIVLRQMELNRIPGVAVAVVERGRIVKLAAYGTANLEWDAPVGIDTRFQLASATKMFTGVLLMRLVEQDKLSLDDPVTRWLRTLPQAGRRYA
ncbi:MAG: class A beta-lactamase-related serine hydrolase [Sphingomonadales bacterium]|nr:MAG: class A beta-lactamase-related serine hydrolase [Sphingomonadales bacterium]